MEILIKRYTYIILHGEYLKEGLPLFLVYQQKNNQKPQKNNTKTQKNNIKLLTSDEKECKI